MSELTFSQQFLIALDSRPIKLSSDHIADPRSYPPQSATTLPRLPHPPHPARPPPRRLTTTTTTSSSTPSPPSTLTITLKPLRSTPTSSALTLPSLPLTTSVYDLKTLYSTHTTLAIQNIKLLFQKKPVPDSKTVKELINGGSDVTPSVTEVEFSVMVIGGGGVGGGGGGVGRAAASTPPIISPVEEMLPPKVAQGPSGAEELKTEAFWGDLRGFLVQRLRDEGEGERLAGVFREAWERS